MRGIGLRFIVTADDLFALDGVNISQARSWERASRDFSFAIRTMEQISQCLLLIILIGTESAILHRYVQGQQPIAVRIFDPFRLEEDFFQYQADNKTALLRRSEPRWTPVLFNASRFSWNLA